MNKKIINTVLIIVILFQIIIIPTRCNATIQDTIFLEKTNINEILPYTYDGKDITMYQRLVYSGMPVYNLNEWMENEETTISKVKLYDNEEIMYILKNGYPNKTPYELGCDNWMNAYIATQEAICKVIYNRDIYLYNATSTKGEMILNAMKNILSSSKEETETLNLECNNNEWKEYSEDTNYFYKEYKVKFNKIIQNGAISIQNGDGVKIVDSTNTEKNTIEQTDKFKTLVPNSISQSFNVIINADIINYIPYLYSKNNRNYIVFEKEITAMKKNINLELDITSNIKIINTNENNLPIIGHTFELLDKQHNIIKENLKTDSNGEILINNIEKGVYYLRQKKVTSAYEVNTSLIEINVTGFENVIEISVKNLKTQVEETTITNKHINFEENHKNIVEENVTQIDNIVVDNITKEVINKRNETNTKILNNFVNTTNIKDITDYIKTNTYSNITEQNNYRINELQGEISETKMNRKDFINYIDLVKFNEMEVPKLPEACK